MLSFMLKELGYTCTCMVAGLDIKKFLAFLRKSSLKTNLIPEKKIYLFIVRLFFLLVQGPVPLALHLFMYNFYLSRTKGQSLMRFGK